MKRVLTTCDLCGREINSHTAIIFGKTSMKIKIKNAYIDTHTKRLFYEKADICGFCKQEIIDRSLERSKISEDDYKVVAYVFDNERRGYLISRADFDKYRGK